MTSQRPRSAVETRVSMVDDVMIVGFIGGGPTPFGPPDPVEEWVRGEMNRSLQEGTRAFVIDLSTAHDEFVDSIRLASFVRAYRKIRDHVGELKVVLAPRHIEIWTRFNLHEVIPFCESVSTAVSSLGKLPE